MKNPPQPTYLSYLQQLPNLLQEPGLDKHHFQESNIFIEKYYHLFDHVLYLLDYRTKHYLLFTENCIKLVNYPAAAFYEGGLEFSFHIWNPKDVTCFNETIFNENFKFFSSTEYDDSSNYRVRYNYRVKSKDGKWVDILQQSTITERSSNNLPLASFGILSDITPYNPFGRITHQIERLNTQLEWESILNRYYFPDIDEDDLLSKAEIEILKWVLEGLSSQKIADKLNRSLHTIKTHRRNMLQKTNANNTAELLRFAISRGLI